MAVTCRLSSSLLRPSTCIVEPPTLHSTIYHVKHTSHTPITHAQLSIFLLCCVPMARTLVHHATSLPVGSSEWQNPKCTDNVSNRPLQLELQERQELKNLWTIISTSKQRTGNSHAGLVLTKILVQAKLISACLVMLVRAPCEWNFIGGHQTKGVQTVQTQS